MAIILLICGFTFIIFLFSLVSYLYAQDNISLYTQITPSTTFTFLREVASIAEDRNSTQIFDPEGAGIDSADNVYINDIGPNEIKKYDKNGIFITSWGSEGEGDGQFNMPWDVAVIENDEIYIPDYRNNRIQIFSTEGEFIREFGSQGEGEGQFLKPESITVDSKGRIYVADTTNNNVQLFLSRGSNINFDI